MCFSARRIARIRELKNGKVGYRDDSKTEARQGRQGTDVPSLSLLRDLCYAVLLPSIPLPDGTCDPYMELANGVLPAVDKVIEMGIADANRLGIMGHSYGGYSTYGLITQTNRFQAAVALAGLSNLISSYGT